METVLVIDVKHPDGEYLINKSDFDPTKHVLKGEEKQFAKKAKTESGK